MELELFSWPWSLDLPPFRYSCLCYHVLVQGSSVLEDMQYLDRAALGCNHASYYKLWIGCKASHETPFPPTPLILYVASPYDAYFHLSTSTMQRCNDATIQEEELKDAILLVFANKQDLKGALNAAQVS